MNSQRYKLSETTLLMALNLFSRAMYNYCHKMLKKRSCSKKVRHTIESSLFAARENAYDGGLPFITW